MELPWSDATKPPEGVAMVPVSQDPKMTRGIMPAKWHCYGSGSTKPPNDSRPGGRPRGVTGSYVTVSPIDSSGFRLAKRYCIGSDTTEPPNDSGGFRLAKRYCIGSNM